MSTFLANLKKRLNGQRQSRAKNVRRQTGRARRWITAHSSKGRDSVALIRAIRDGR